MELIVLGLVLLALRANAASKGATTTPPKAGTAAPAGGGGVDVKGLVTSGIGAGVAIAGALGGGTAATGTIGGAGAAAGGKTAATAAGVGGGVSAGAVAAVVIVVAWVVLVTTAIFLGFDAASRRAWRRGLGASGLWAVTRGGIKKSENEFAKAMIQKLGGTTTSKLVPAVKSATGPNEIVPAYMVIDTVLGLSVEQLDAIAIAARFLAVAQARGRNDAVRAFFTRDFNDTPERVAENGDAMEASTFEELVAVYYQEPFLNVPGAPTWVQAQPLIPARIHAVARFGGQMLGIQYAIEQLRGGTLFPAGYTQDDVLAAAAAVPAGHIGVAYHNRVFDLGHEQRACVLFDNAAQLAWLPNYSNGSDVKLFPYETRDFIGPGVGA